MGNRMSLSELRQLCNVLMNADHVESSDLQYWANNEAIDHGYDDWVDAYHKL